jgi:UDP-GlcNAc:undecaprenyl-phosphate GlcNAc-1-phosphate transferase
MRFIADAGTALPWMIAVFVAAAVLSLVLTPAVRRLVTRHGMIDRPEARRVNTVPIPRAGGLAVAAAFLLVAATFVVINERLRLVRIPFLLTDGELAALLLGGAGAAALGALDDYFDLRARWQLLMQLGLATFAVALGIHGLLDRRDDEQH